MKIEAHTLQDLYHYALGIQRKDSTFDCRTLAQRLELCASAKALWWKLEEVELEDIYINDEAETVEGLCATGEALEAACIIIGKRDGIDPRTGISFAQACREGKRAYHTGGVSNPYGDDENDALSRNWLQGWLAAQSEPCPDELSKTSDWV